MNINILQKLGLSAALVVSIVSCFPQSAQAQLFRFSGQSNTKEGTGNSVLAEFILDTDKGVIENFTAIEDTTGTPLLNVSSPTASITPSELTGNDLTFVSNILGQLDQELGSEELNNVVKYELTSFDGLPNYEATLYIPYRTEGEENNLIASLGNFDNAFEDNEEIRNDGIPGILIRDFNKKLDVGQEINLPNQKGVVAVDIFGIADTGTKFTVEEIQDIPEPTTAAGLLAALFVGGLSLRKGDNFKGHAKSDRHMKSKAIIKN